MKPELKPSKNVLAQAPPPAPWTEEFRNSSQKFVINVLTSQQKINLSFWVGITGDQKFIISVVWVDKCFYFGVNLKPLKSL